MFKLMPPSNKIKTNARAAMYGARPITIDGSNSLKTGPTRTPTIIRNSMSGKPVRLKK
jgi:hypothetical protein